LDAMLAKSGNKSDVKASSAKSPVAKKTAAKK
jgi:hypothetical protein